MIIPRLVAHRGYPRHYPENTLIGLEAALHAPIPETRFGVFRM